MIKQHDCNIAHLHMKMCPNKGWDKIIKIIKDLMHVCNKIKLPTLTARSKGVKLYNFYAI